MATLMTPGVCATCGDTTLTAHADILPEVAEYRCAEGHAIYWHLREDRELTLKDLRAIRRDWGEA